MSLEHILEAFPPEILENKLLLCFNTSKNTFIFTANYL